MSVSDLLRRENVVSDIDDQDPRIASILAGAHVAVVGTLTPSGAPHLSAVWFERQDEDVIFMVSSRSRKVANIHTDSRVELCVNTGPMGPCATAVGHAAVLGPASPGDLQRIASRYLGTEGAIAYVGARPSRAESVLVRIRPERWRIFPGA